MITTHVLDITQGVPAAGLSVILEARRGSEWQRVSSGETDDRGRLTSLTAPGMVTPGVYRLTFDTGDYQNGLGISVFFPEVQVVFDVREGDDHVHVPLVLSAYGYSIYRGS
jgi:5-hydroxyisourate hydrolase